MRSWPSPEVPTLAGPSVPLRLFDTSDQVVRPVNPGAVSGMYVCGITPYDATHLGHAATYLTFDLVNRVLRANGHEVHYVQNVTDVDDPLFERAERDGIDWRDLGARETDLFREDMEALRVVPPQDYIGAVESIDEVIELVGRLLENGAAYIVDDPEFPDVYYRADATEQFGYESGYDRATMDRLFAERGGDPDRPGKRDPIDALLWRAARPGEPSWPSPQGPGRPGWHVECAAIAANRLGVGFDIQGGGSDLIFPHHEFSAARRGRYRRAPLRPALRARRDDRTGRREDVQEPRQPRLRLEAPPFGSRSFGDPARALRGPLPHGPRLVGRGAHPRADPTGPVAQGLRRTVEPERRRAGRPAPPLSGRRSRHPEGARRDRRVGRSGRHRRRSRPRRADHRCQRHRRAPRRCGIGLAARRAIFRL
jgi:hypothetical protein